MITDEVDIIVTLRGALKTDGRSDITINYAEMDSNLGLLSGSTKSHIKAAANGAGYDVVTEGPSLIELRRRRSIGRIVRA